MSITKYLSGLKRLKVGVVLMISLVVASSATVQAGCPEDGLGHLETIPPALKELIRKSFDPVIQVAEGGYKGSGGEGLICFENREDAESAMDSNTGKLKPEYRSKIARVSAYDVVKFRFKYWPVAPAMGEAAGDYLERAIDEGIGADIPELGAKLKDYIRRFIKNEALDRWEDVGALPKLYDGENAQETLEEKRARVNQIYLVQDGSSPPKVEYCRRVQIAIRFSENLPPGQWPKFFIDVDGDLMKRMANGPSWSDSILFPIVIRSHELLYMAANVLGMKDSVATQEFISMILAGNVASEIRRLPRNERAQAWKKRIQAIGFNDLTELLKYPVTSEIPSKENARKSYAQIQLLHNQAAAEVENLNAKDAIRQKVFENASPEQAFLLGMTLLSPSRTLPFSVGMFLEDGIRNAHHYRIACADFNRRLSDPHVSDIPSLKLLMEKSVRYCGQVLPAIK